jgi:hypothetical protein
MRMAQKNAALGASAMRFMFSFLELAFPESLMAAAIEKTLLCLEENMKYVESCGLSEAATFLYAPFELPRDVMEMAAVLGKFSLLTLISNIKRRGAGAGGAAKLCWRRGFLLGLRLLLGTGTVNKYKIWQKKI